MITQLKFLTEFVYTVVAGIKITNNNKSVYDEKLRK